MIEIREFVEDDYPAVASIMLTHYPDSPFSAEAMRHFDQQMEPKLKLRRWVGVVDGQVVGFCQMNYSQLSYHPDELWINLMVHPDHLRRGYGTALYDHLLLHVAEESPARMKTTIKEDNEGGMAFAAKQGFEEYAQRFESLLDVENADLTQFLASLKHVAARGIEIKSFAELRDEPDFARKMYELFQATMHDVPLPDPVTEELTFEVFSARFLNGPDVLNDGSFVALHGDEYAGLTLIFEPAPGRIYVGYTAILSSYRRKGIATALKVRGIQYAREHGYTTMGTTNDTSNQAILSLNTAMGFVRQPAWVLVVKQL